MTPQQRLYYRRKCSGVCVKCPRALDISRESVVCEECQGRNTAVKRRLGQARTVERLGTLLGGLSRAQALSAKRRSEIARAAALARWNRAA